MIEYKLKTLNIRTLQDVFVTISCVDGDHADEVLHKCYQVNKYDGSWNQGTTCHFEDPAPAYRRLVNGLYRLYSVLKIPEADK